MSTAAAAAVSSSSFINIVTIANARPKQWSIFRAMKFDFEYFDGSREQGYGGYKYDGRWVAVAERLKDRYKLREGSRFLDVGCAKGFLMHDCQMLMTCSNI